ncbi:hypothetical protein [Indiicoccus explosivorum]|uniref:hypothetical protein n=1 Tax=Indiicoccus explosivorum TaxID=1917864 RepID=UPI000B44707E|nr:hypothetical protein [Indiicoccus explosivorum]
MRKIAGIVALIAVIVILAAFAYPRTDRYQIAEAAKGVFDHAIEGEYAEAAEYVYFFDGPTDVEPSISQAQGKALWIERIRALEEEGISLAGYEDLSIERDDGILKATVDLIIEMDGGQTVRENVNLMFAERNGDWKLQHLEELRNDAVEAWEQALSGHVQRTAEAG